MTTLFGSFSRFRRVLARHIGSDNASRNGTDHRGLRVRSIDDGVRAIGAQGPVPHLNPAAESLTVWTESEARYRTVFEEAPAGFLVIDPETALPLEFNDTASKQLGYSREEFAQLRISDYEADESPEQTRVHLEKVLSEGRDDFETRHRTKTGELRNVQVTVKRTEINGRTVITCIFRDITERICAENAVREANQRLTEVLESISDGFFSMDDRLVVSYFNGKAEELLGCSSNEVLGRNLFEAIPEARGSVFEEMYTLAVREKKALTFETFFDTSPFKNWYEVRVYPSKQGISVFFQVTTDQKRAEAEVQKVKSQLEAALQSMTDAVLVADTDGRLLAFNCAAMTYHRFKRNDAMPKTFHECCGILEVLLPDGTPVPTDAWSVARAVEGESASGAEYRLRRKDTGESWFGSYSFGPVRDQHGAIIGSVIVARDITERKRLEERYLQAQKMEAFGRLAGGIAHDFNNLLTVINGYCDLALTKLDARDPVRDEVTEVRAAGQRATELTRQLLAFSRKQVTRPKVLQLNRIVQDVEKMLERVIGEDVKLKTTLHPELWKLEADPGQIIQVLMNLAVNSRDAMPRGGHLHIETCNAVIDERYAREHADIAPGSYVQLTVSDSGTGMDATTRARIFEPFFTTKESGKGTGLGLATVYGIVKQAGGFIGVDSELGHGTAFRIYFPRLEGDRHVDVPQPDHATTKGTETILLVEDQPELRDLTERVLNSHGYTVLKAESGEEACAKAESHNGPIHLLLVDMVLPGMDGLELAARLAPLRPEMSVLYMSGYSEESVVRLGVLPEGLEYLSKPFTVDELVRKLRGVLGPVRRSGTILVVDDDPAVRRYFQSVLEGAGFHVLTAEGGKQAITQAVEGNVDLAITDLIMPEQHGAKTIQLLLRQKPDLKIIAVSGASNSGYLRVARLLGARATLRKPIRPDRLVKTVTAVLVEDR